MESDQIRVKGIWPKDHGCKHQHNYNNDDYYHYNNDNDHIRCNLAWLYAILK